MQGPIAQTLALVIAANARLRGQICEVGWPQGAVFQFCRTVRFVDPDAGGWLRRKARVVAETPPAWLESFAPGTRGIRVRVSARNDPAISDRMSVGFVGGGPRWQIEVVGPQASDVWEDSWAVGDPDAPDRRIWDVTYNLIEKALIRPDLVERDLAVIKADLAEALEGIARFSIQHDLGFTESFEAGLGALDADAPLRGTYHADIDAAGLLPPAAQQLMVACQHAWVFGGMGSWNDRYCEDDIAEEVERRSDRLFGLLVEGLAAATNSTFKPQAPFPPRS